MKFILFEKSLDRRQVSQELSEGENNNKPSQR